jgi:CheY-like chemotaxis protein
MNPGDLRVLVIEDEADSELVLSSTLRFGGIQSISAGSAEEALEILQTTDVNLLMVDLALPGMDGWAFLQTVRSDESLQHVPAVVVSAYLTPTVAQKAIRAGFLACFPKPIDTTSLVRELMNLFN